MAASTPDSGGVYVVPAFTGLGSPWWDPYARGTIVGITRGTSKAHLARAVVEAMAYQTRDAVEAMAAASGTTLAALRVDGGASVMDVLLQMQADQLGVTVQRPIDQETTALGAAYLAGLAEGVWPSLDAINERWQIDATFEPEPDRTFTDLGHADVAARRRAFSRLDRAGMKRGVTRRHRYVRGTAVRLRGVGTCPTSAARPTPTHRPTAATMVQVTPTAAAAGSSRAVDR